jgi:predicted nucleic acid-binding protein
MLALRSALEINGATETPTFDTELLARQCEIEEKYGLSYFDSLIAASALKLIDGIISDDESFDKVPGVIRTPLT